MKKIISFSLYVTSDQKIKPIEYLVGAVRNAELAAQIYPGWVCRFYVAPSVPQEIIEKLASNSNTEIIRKEAPDNQGSMFWRFEPISDPDVEVMISRDCDSRLSMREKAAVDEWLSGDKHFHIMRDTYLGHGVTILGGMWGARKPILANMSQLIQNYPNLYGRQHDQKFLAKEIYPLIINDCCVHDEFFECVEGEECHPFPLARQEFEFVGEHVDEYDVPYEAPRRYLKDYLAKSEGKRAPRTF